MSDETRTCTRCHQTLPIDQFYLYHDRRHRRQYQHKRQCKECERIYRREHDRRTKASGKCRVNMPMDRHVWSAFRSLCAARNVRLGDALEMLVRRELQRVQEREVLEALRRRPA